MRALSTWDDERTLEEDGDPTERRVWLPEESGMVARISERQAARLTGAHGRVDEPPPAAPLRARRRTPGVARLVIAILIAGSLGWISGYLARWLEDARVAPPPARLGS